MTDWIKVVTDIGLTRIRLDAICAYQETSDEETILIYTSDDTIFEVIENCNEVLLTLDNNFSF